MPVSTSGYQSDGLAIELYESLISGHDLGDTGIDVNDPVFDFPESLINILDSEVAPLNLDALSSGNACGGGSIDRLIQTVRAILIEEYNSNRITQAEYSKTLVAMVGVAMQSGTQFLLGRDTAYWQAIRAKVEAATMRVGYETERMNYKLRKAELRNSSAQFALTKLKLATEDMSYGAAKYQIEEMLPAQKKLVQEQTEVQRAQTLDTRSDLLPVTGSVGKQKDLYTQQITSYQRDAEIKAARPFIDAWITQKTVDEGLLPPNGFTNASLDTILSKVKLSNGFT